MKKEAGLRCANIEKKIKAFSLSLTFSIPRGKLLTILGPSGCGKTTLLMLCAGFLEPDSGSFFLGERDITKIQSCKRNIGFVFQDYALFPHMNVSENIAYGPRARKWDRKKVASTTEKLLDTICLQDMKTRRISTLSGGEQQRVALARALAPNPDLLLLDEPLSALDAGMRRVLRREIRNVQQDSNLTTIYVTHDQEEALTISDYIAVMNNGRIEQIGTPEEVYHNPETYFSASFVGLSNIISGTILSVEKERVFAESEIGNFYIHSQGKDFVKDQKIHFFFRPEDCILTANRKHSYNTLNLTPRSIEFYGSYYKIEALTNRRILQIAVPKREMSDKHNIKTAFIDPEDIKILENQR